MNPKSKIESILFFKGEPVSLKDLSSMISVSIEEVRSAVQELSEDLSERGISIVQTDETVELRTSAENSEVIEKLKADDLNRDIGKAGLETLSIVLYYAPVTRSEIDYIRGVNSTFTLRSLLVRGLVERVSNKDDQRSFLYRPTSELLSFLGVTKVHDLPEYESVRSDIAKINESDTSEDSN